MASARQRAGAALNRAKTQLTGPLTGLLGGSFNPAHGGHRRITQFAIRALGLDEAWWLVSPGNPLKPAQGMAPLPARIASARQQARRAPIRVSAMEREFSTRFTVDTLRKILRRWPKRRFIWLMGADNLAQFHRWRHWRDIARMVPIAVIARPGYDGAAIASPAMVWLGRYRRSAARFRNSADWSAPRLVILRFDPDSRSATAIRSSDPHWASRMPTRAVRDSDLLLRDGVTRRLILPDNLS